MAVEPRFAGDEGSKAHTHMKSDAALLREDGHGRIYLGQETQNLIEGLPYVRCATEKMLVETYQPVAAMSLVAIGEGSLTAGAHPHRLARIVDSPRHRNRSYSD